MGMDGAAGIPGCDPGRCYRNLKADINHYPDRAAPDKSTNSAQSRRAAGVGSNCEATTESSLHYTDWLRAILVATLRPPMSRTTLVTSSNERHCGIFGWNSLSCRRFKKVCNYFVSTRVRGREKNETSEDGSPTDTSTCGFPKQN